MVLRLTLIFNFPKTNVSFPKTNVSFPKTDVSFWKIYLNNILYIK